MLLFQFRSHDLKHDAIYIITGWGDSPNMYYFKPKKNRCECFLDSDKLYLWKSIKQTVLVSFQTIEIVTNCEHNTLF